MRHDWSTRAEATDMKHSFEPVVKQSLPDRLARQIRGTIQSGKYRRGDRLPPIVEMARRFEVGQPSIREALKKLETMGVVQIRHGSGVFVSSRHCQRVASSFFECTISSREPLLTARSGGRFSPSSLNTRL